MCVYDDEYKFKTRAQNGAARWTDLNGDGRMSAVYVVGVGMTRFGKYLDKTLKPQLAEWLSRRGWLVAP